MLPSPAMHSTQSAAEPGCGAAASPCRKTPQPHESQSPHGSASAVHHCMQRTRSVRLWPTSCSSPPPCSSRLAASSSSSSCSAAHSACSLDRKSGWASSTRSFRPRQAQPLYCGRRPRKHHLPSGRARHRAQPSAEPRRRTTQSRAGSGCVNHWRKRVSAGTPYRTAM